MTAQLVETIAATVRGFLFRYATEDELQQGIVQALTQAGFDVQREVRLDGASRIDLLVGRVGIEVKVGGSHYDVARQCVRYLKSDRLDGLVLVTSRVRHLRVQGVVDGKPFAVVELAGAGL